MAEILKNEEIFAVNSPKGRVGGPYAIIHKTQYWALVAMGYNNKPRLGIRWFVGGIGTPSSRGNKTWFVLPEEVYMGILNTLPLMLRQRQVLNEFLCEETTSNETISKLQKEYNRE